MADCDCENRMVFYVYKPVTLHIEATVDESNDDEFAVMYTMDDAYGHEEYKDFRNGADNELEPGVYGLWSTGPIALKRMLIEDSSHLEVRFDVMRKDPWPKPPPPPDSRS